jgi:hypothetical protein
LHHIQERNRDNEMKLPCKKCPRCLRACHLKLKVQREIK